MSRKKIMTPTDQPRTQNPVKRARERSKIDSTSPKEIERTCVNAIAANKAKTAPNTRPTGHIRAEGMEIGIESPVSSTRDSRIRSGRAIESFRVLIAGMVGRGARPRQEAGPEMVPQLRHTRERLLSLLVMYKYLLAEGRLGDESPNLASLWQS